MARTYRMLSPASAGSPLTIATRTYQRTPGLAVDADAIDAPILEANGWTRIGMSGPTSARPTHTSDQFDVAGNRTYYDSTLAAVIFHDGAVWRDATGSAV